MVGADLGFIYIDAATLTKENYEIQDGEFQGQMVQEARDFVTSKERSLAKKGSSLKRLS